MTVLHSIDELEHYLCGRPFVSTMGYFDGMHLGHQALIATLAQKASTQGCASVLITLDRHPQEVLRPDLPTPECLTPLPDKLRLLSGQPIEATLVIPFSKNLADQTPEAFLEPLIRLGLKGLVLGYDNRFGRKEPGQSLQEFDTRLLALGLPVHRISQVLVHDKGVSSTAIRRCIKTCDFETATQMLGRPYSLVGEVVTGSRIGRTLSYPTANIRPTFAQQVLPGEGIFAAEVRVGRSVYPAMAYLGHRPSIGRDLEQRLEAYLLGYSGSLYDRQVEIAFRKHLRPDQTFATRAELAQRLALDEAITQAFFAHHPLLLQIGSDPKP